ncbi:MAG: TniQ family protein [Candidatus Cryosericum sp.]
MEQAAGTFGEQSVAITGRTPFPRARSLAYLALPYDDETIRSVIGRTLLRTGQNIGSTPFASAHLSFWTCRVPRHLAAFTSVLNTSWGITSSSLIRHHTLFPYLGAFMTAIQRAALEGTLAGSPIPRFLRMSELTGTACGASWSCCPLCLKEDVAEYGEPHEHLMHTMPVRACPVHGCRLVELNDRPLGTLWRPDPGEMLEAACRHAEDRPAAASRIECAMARASAWLLTHDGCAVLPQLKQVLAPRGGASVSGKSSADSLKQKTARLRAWAAAHDVLAVCMLREDQVYRFLAELASFPSVAAPPAEFVVAVLTYYGIAPEDWPTGARPGSA